MLESITRSEFVAPTAFGIDDSLPAILSLTRGLARARPPAGGAREDILQQEVHAICC